eukprot:CAMPEP_0202891580 /NCGR_PEP_ID=MMETSP1392-20130828/1601_1 /ASSEMBLY_ACC=CAM_ASM_000868 /TAXON_ID=225041 /ORGANISM="Chlamydomonas chlamydogama, Strain SAG 11-48b" /LENGTH=208 /DNA_ID=CAMNT_0049575377 /DNA_START=58 /DNA_END=685 /DNA_ORIENTATION=+
MVRVSVLGDALKTMYNAEKRGKRQVLLRPASKVVIKFLQLMQKHQYIGEFELVDDHRSGKIVVELNGRLNKCGVISPRYDVGFTELEDWIGRLLPSRQFGIIVLTTSAGIMDHEEARRKRVGGKVLGFFYKQLTTGSSSRRASAAGRPKCGALGQASTHTGHAPIRRAYGPPHAPYNVMAAAKGGLYSGAGPPGVPRCLSGESIDASV